MPRNRRSSSASSFKSTIGFSFLKLFLTAVIVVLCVFKVALGGEYISDCPRQPLLPVYVVISGCLPVFLGPLRGSDTSENSQHGEKFCRLTPYNKAVLCFGIIANLSWLIFGTVLLTRLISAGYSDSSECLRSETTGNTNGLLPSRGNSTTPDETDDWKGNLSELNTEEEILDRENKSFRENDDRSSRESIRYTTKAVTITRPLNSTSVGGDNRLINQTLSHEDIVTLTTDNQQREPILSKELQKTFGYNLSKTQHTFLYNETFNLTIDSSECITCSGRLVTFTFVVVSIDWIVALFGIIFVTAVLCCRMPSLKELVPFLGSV